MSRTKAQVAIKVLEKLRVLEGGGTADTDDQTLVEEAYEDFYEELRSRHLVSWDVASSIPNGAIRPLVGLLALEVSDEFEVPEVVVQRLTVLEDRNKARLAVLIAPDYVSAPIEAEYY